MPFNGSGVFQRAYNWVNDAALSINITASRVDADSNDFASGLSNCITRDGQGVPSATISWNNQRLADLAPAVDAKDAVSFSFADGRYLQIAGAADARYLLINGANAMIANFNAGGFQVNNAAPATTANDLVTYAQLSAATGSSTSTLLAGMNYYSYTTFFGL